MLCRKLGIIYTTNCNIRCKHCFWEKDNTDLKIDNCLFEEILEACIENNIRKICITGGEPLLYDSDIFYSLNHFSKKINEISLCTNAFWSDNLTAARALCNDLKYLGITELEISADYYHQQHIPLKNVLNAVITAKELQLNVKVIVCFDNTPNHIPIIGELLRYMDYNDIILQHVAEYGNAINENITCRLPISEFENLKCGQILNQPCIDCKGKIYACCGPYLSYEMNSPFYCGKFNKQSFKATLERMQYDTGFQQISKNGPLKYLYNQNKLPANICYSSLCELCCECLTQRKIEQKQFTD